MASLEERLNELDGGVRNRLISSLEYSMRNKVRHSEVRRQYIAGAIVNHLDSIGALKRKSEPLRKEVHSYLSYGCLKVVHYGTSSARATPVEVLNALENDWLSVCYYAGVQVMSGVPKRIESMSTYEIVLSYIVAGFCFLNKHTKVGKGGIPLPNDVLEQMPEKCRRAYGEHAARSQRSYANRRGHQGFLLLRPTGVGR